MSLSKSQRLILSASAVAIFAIVVSNHFRDREAVAPLLQRNAVRGAVRYTAPHTESRGTLLKTSAVAVPKARHNWAKEYNASTDYFKFVSNAAQNAFDGDGGASLYISKALYVCLPIARQFANSADPEAAFSAHWANATKAPQWVVDQARKDFDRCKEFIKGDAFSALPARPGGYNSSSYWMAHAIKDQNPVALALQAGTDIADSMNGQSGTASEKSIETAQIAINKAVTSGDPAALFQVGQLLSDGGVNSNPLQGFAVSIAACDLGYDCTANNAELFGGCAAEGMCPPGTSYSDVIKKAVGEDGYAKAYAIAQQLEYAITRGDITAVKQFVQLKRNQ